MADFVLPLRPDKQQRTLLSLSKVVRLDSSSVCFSRDDITKLKAELLDVTKTKHELLTMLRKLDCYKLEVGDIQSSDIGVSVATLASHHPKPDVARLAQSLLQKWRDIVETSLFHPVLYDVVAASEAPEGESVAPEVLIAAEKEQQRLDKIERRRQRIEQDFMATSSDDDLIESSQGTDPEWAPKLSNRNSGGSKRTYRSRAYAEKATQDSLQRSGEASAPVASTREQGEVLKGSSGQAAIITKNSEAIVLDDELVRATSNIGKGGEGVVVG